MKSIGFFKIFLFILAFNLNAAKHQFYNNTGEVIDLEVNYSGDDYTRVYKNIMPSVSPFVFESPRCVNGINIWRTYWPRNWQGLLGTWKYSETFGANFEKKPGFPCGENIWRLSYNKNSRLYNKDAEKDIFKVEPETKRILESEDKILLKTGAGYNLDHFGRDRGIFRQGSDDAWEAKLFSVLAN